MRTEIHPAARRITWLMIVIGAGATLVSIVYGLFNLGPGVMLPFTKTPLDTGWLAIFGLLWLVSRVLLLWWLRPEEMIAARAEPSRDKQITAIESRLQKLEAQVGTQDTTIQNLKTWFDELGESTNGMVEQRANYYAQAAKKNNLAAQ